MIKKCKRCNVDLEIGKSLDYHDDYIRVEYPSFSDGKLITCWKCPKCGHSESFDDLAKQG